MEIPNILQTVDKCQSEIGTNEITSNLIELTNRF